MATPERAPSSPHDPDQRVVLHGVSWKEFELLLAIRGDQGGVRLTYLEGDVELMSPSRTHEGIKKTLARMLEAYALERGIVLEGFGSWTLKSAPAERGLEPDECYVLGEGAPDVPDLAIEVIWTSGGLDKLEVYRGLGVREVWIWRDAAIEMYVLHEQAYRRVGASRLLPDLDPDLLSRCLRDASSQSDAVRAFVAAVHASE